jgi:AmmeMemoRadiSam system protein B/AmmeMemoRadiSam system protein A
MPHNTLFPFLKYVIMIVSKSLLKEEIMDKSYMIDIAKNAIKEVLLKKPLLDKEALLKSHPELAQKGAVFVTLEKREQLRGCMGSLIAHRTLIEDLIHNAVSAAFHDPRFPPLTRQEFEQEDFTLEISLLSQPQALSYNDVDALKREVRVGIDGVILKEGNHQATFLPQVWEQLPEFDAFFAHLCQKAGLPARCLEQHPEIYLYQVEKIEVDKKKRKAGVRGAFYPQNCREVEAMIKEFNQQVDSSAEDMIPRAIIVPHAGYIYSGFTANLAYRLLAKSHAKRVLVFGPSHHVYFEGISASFQTHYETPCGEIEIDSAYLRRLKEAFSLKFVEKAHGVEHSTETQMPFIKHYLPDAKVLEFIYGKVDYHDIVKLILMALRDKDNVVVISTDLSHFYTEDEANRVDGLCLEGIAKKDIKILEKGCEACGMLGMKAILTVAEEENMDIRLLDYRTSAQRSGDKSRVVGYVSAAIK